MNFFVFSCLKTPGRDKDELPKAQSEAEHDVDVSSLVPLVYVHEFSFHFLSCLKKTHHRRLQPPFITP
jgi:hypothetical protein